MSFIFTFAPSDFAARSAIIYVIRFLPKRRTLKSFHSTDWKRICIRTSFRGSMMVRRMWRLPSRLIKGLEDLGYKKFITTPHVMEDMYPNNPGTIQAAYDILKDELKAQKKSIRGSVLLLNTCWMVM